MAVKEHRHCSFLAILALKVERVWRDVLKGEILSTKSEMLNNVKARMTEIQSGDSFVIRIWHFEFVQSLELRT